jgi:hypothetical protein
MDMDGALLLKDIAEGVKLADGKIRFPMELS